MNTELSVVDTSQYVELSRFLAAFAEDGSSEAAWLLRLGHWWDRNPTFSKDVARGWLLRAESGTIVGFLGNIPRLFRSNGRDRKVFCATTWRVLPHYRHSSLRLYAAHVAAGQGTMLFNTTANTAAAKVLEHLKYQSLPKSGTGKAYLLPLNAGHVARSYLGGRGRSASLFGLGRLALRAASLPLEVRLATSRHRTARTIDQPGQEFDALWLRTRDEVASASVRTREQIEWLCAGGARPPKVIVGVFEADALVAYGVFRPAQRDDLRMLVLVDFWPPSSDSATVRALLAEAVGSARRTGYDMIVLHAFGKTLASTFRRSGLLLATPSLSRVFCRANGLPLDERDAYLTDFDGDSVL